MNGGPPRSVALDVLRAVAVLFVIGRHLPSTPEGLFPPFAAVFVTWRQIGWVGVDLFFVLSGYLVSGLVLSELERYGSFKPIRFLMRRGLKIYPAFWAMLGVTVAVRAALGSGIDVPGSMAELLFVQNYFPGLWFHTWSLAVEEHFYLAIALVFVLLPVGDLPRTLSQFIRVASVVFVAVLAMRLVLFDWAPYAFPTHLFPSHLRFDALLFGVILRVLASRDGDRLPKALWRRAWLVVPGALGTIAAVVRVPLEGSFFVNTVGLSLLSLSFGALLLLALRFEALCPAYIHVWPARALAGVGAHSYSIYLWHIPVIFWCGRGLKQELPSLPYLPSVTLLVCASLVVGWGAARLIELPVLKFRDRFFPSRSIGAIPVASGPGPA